MNSESELVELAVFPTEGEAQSVAGMLRAHEIPANVLPRATGGTLPIPTATTGITVLVPITTLDDARRLLANAHAAQQLQDEEDRAFARTGYGKKSPSEISTGLAELRARRRLALIVFLSFIPISIVLVGIFQHDNTIWIVFITWGIVFAMCNFRVYHSRCPACGEHFHKKSPYSNVLIRNCLHCGIPLHGEGNDV